MDPEPAPRTPRPVSRVVVGLEDDASEAAVAAAMTASGIDDPRVLFDGVLIGDCAADDALLTRLRRLPGVRYAEWDRIETL